MSKASVALGAAGLALLLTGMLATGASAQREREEGERCKGEMIKAAGKATILGKGRARRLAIDNWQREVRQKYGEKFMDFSRARQARHDCESASIGAIGRLNQRCTVSAYPCAFASVADDEKDVGSGPDGATWTVQRWLKRAGYLDRDDIDGEFGPKTRRALEKFQRDEGLRVTGEADERTRERLRRRAERG